MDTFLHLQVCVRGCPYEYVKKKTNKQTKMIVKRLQIKTYALKKYINFYATKYSLIFTGKN